MNKQEYGDTSFLIPAHYVEHLAEQAIASKTTMQDLIERSIAHTIGRHTCGKCLTLVGRK